MLHPGLSLLVLDLSRVPSCDPAGLAVLIGTQRRARLLGIVVRLAAPSLPVAKLLRLTGLDRSLTICPDLRGALAVERHEPAKASPAPQVLAGEAGALPARHPLVHRGTRLVMAPGLPAARDRLLGLPAEYRGSNADPEFFVRTDAVKGAASQKRARACGSYLHQYDPRQNS